jgi:iron complex outermembrane receptor protein
MTAYRTSNQRFFLDGDATELRLLGIDFGDVQHQLSEELTVVGHTTKLTWIGGAFLFHDHDRGPVEITLYSPGIQQRPDPTFSTRAWALFGQATYQVSDRVSVTGGLRYTDEAKDLANTGGVYLLGAFTRVSFYDYVDRATYDAWTPKVSLQARATPDAFFYVSATRGFKSGGFDFGSPTAADATKGYNPEYLWAYEIGVKSDWLEHRLRVNLDAFFYDYSDMQVEVFVPPANAITENAATSHIKGVDLEVAARPIAPLDLHATVAYLHARYQSFPQAFVNPFGTFDASGNTLNQAPDWAYSAGATYTVGLGHLGSVYGGVDYTGQSRVFFTPANNGVNGVTGYPQQQEEYGVLSARAGWNSADSRWNFAVIGLNLTQRQYVTGTVNYGAGVAGRPGDPRTVRGQVTYKF